MPTGTRACGRAFSTRKPGESVRLCYESYTHQSNASVIRPLAPVGPIPLHALGNLLAFFRTHRFSSAAPPTTPRWGRNTTGCFLQFL